MLSFFIGVGLINQLLFQGVSFQQPNLEPSPDPRRPLSQPIVIQDNQKINKYLNQFERYDIYRDFSDREYQQFFTRLVLLIKTHQQRQKIKLFNIESVSFEEKYGKNAFETGPSDVPLGPGVGLAGRDIKDVHDLAIYMKGIEIMHLKKDPAAQFGLKFDLFSKNPNIKITSPVIKANYGVLRMNSKGEVLIQPDLNKDKIGDPFVILITAKGISCLRWNGVEGYTPITNSKECEAEIEMLKNAPPRVIYRQKK